MSAAQKVTEEQLTAVFMAGFSSGYDTALTSAGMPDVVAKAVAHRTWHQVMNDPLHRLEVLTAAQAACRHPDLCPAHMTVTAINPTEGDD